MRGALTTPHLRIARPVSDLARACAQYRDGLGLHEIGRFADHGGFDGVMLGFPDAAWHLEFTHCRAHPVAPTPTAEDLIVLYIAAEADWRDACARVLAAGFRAASPFNPYWANAGRTFIDPDGYRIVLQHGRWSGDALRADAPA